MPDEIKEDAIKVEVDKKKKKKRKKKSNLKVDKDYNKELLQQLMSQGFSGKLKSPKSKKKKHKRKKRKKKAIVKKTTEIKIILPEGTPEQLKEDVAKIVNQLQKQIPKPKGVDTKEIQAKKILIPDKVPEKEKYPSKIEIPESKEGILLPEKHEKPEKVKRPGFFKRFFGLDKKPAVHKEKLEPIVIKQSKGIHTVSTLAEQEKKNQEEIDKIIEEKKKKIKEQKNKEPSSGVDIIYSD